MGFLNNDFEPWPDCNTIKYPDRPLCWTDEDEERYQKELKEKEERENNGFHFHSLQIC